MTPLSIRSTRRMAFPQLNLRPWRSGSPGDPPGLPRFPRRAIRRHRTALHRGDLSRPARCALRDGLNTPTTSVFDFGCGHGRDVEFLQAQGIACTGWDPVFFPEHSLHEADVVQLGYVINVIEHLD